MRRSLWAVFPTLILGLACGSDVEEIVEDIGDLGEKMTDAAMGTSDDPCCQSGAEGELMDGQCQDDYIYSRVCEEEPRCCEEQWYPQCAEGYARFSTACEGGASAGDNPSGRERSGPFEPSTAIQADHPALLLPVTVSKSEGITLPESGTLFVVGFREVESKSGRPARGTRPLHFGRLDVQFGDNDFPFTGTLKAFTGFHYWVMFSTHANPSAGDHMSQLIEAQPELSEEGMRFVIGEETIPEDADSDTPPGTQGN